MDYSVSFSLAARRGQVEEIGVSDSMQDELERLRAIEERHRLLFTNMGAAFVLYEMISDASGSVVDARVLEVNPAYEQMIGKPGEQLVGRTMRELMPYFDAAWLELLSRVAASGVPASRVDYIVEHDRYVDVRVYRPRPGQAAVQRYDVSDQKRAEQNMLERDARLDALVASGVVGQGARS